ncbi:PqqD family protein [Sphingomonas sp. BN140010]|uniref:PqqD family protein n=1 Tax=Sphingomonas arvum TaxID=2992113 RepID=A0ABT3JEB5_9SPHN|nr:PqqD family protein [Sphingomonas sp. BN140010]MCW3797430.1 PqqD family protein [Sphingomonas sp. BN140010]
MEPRYVRARELMEADMDDELVALDPQGGLCFGFNSVATSVWKLLAESRSEAELQSALGEEYDVAPEQCRTELRELLDDLTGKGLIKAAPQG